MGLIKTAMMTGAGIYAVKQLAKTAERRDNNQSRNDHNDNRVSRGNGYPNHNWGPPGPPPPRAYPHQAYSAGNYNDQMGSYNRQDRLNQQGETATGQPPSYYQQGYCATGRQDQNDDICQGKTGTGGLAGVGMGFAGSRASSGRN
ncbi:hypothetical protein DL98DRAFT_541347 [Cadophora sp. DSE1049]|nr:hypothetical protein DL98DRAFT_541347 [Cadophora sp. DSE1049]